MGVKNSKTFIDMNGEIHRIDNISYVKQTSVFGGCEVTFNNGKTIFVGGHQYDNIRKILVKHYT